MSLPDLTKGPTRAQEKARRLRAQLRGDAAVYRAVTLRDGWRCRAYGTPLTGAGHRHHIVFRSQGGQTITSNLVVLSLEAHLDVHQRVLTITGDANHRLTFTKGGTTWDG